MKEQLREFFVSLKNVDFNNTPNVVFLRHLKKHLHAQSTSYGTGVTANIIENVLGHLDVDFSYFGMECSFADDEYLSDIAELFAETICKAYDSLHDLGEGVFIGMVKRINISLT